METVVQKWGNSLGIRIPFQYVKELNLKSGSPVKIIQKDGHLVIIPPRKTLEEMLLRVSIENKHTPVETGNSVGNEEW